jgi:hypothetical protein
MLKISTEQQLFSFDLIEFKYLKENNYQDSAYIPYALFLFDETQ